VIMKDGFIMQIGTPQQVFNHPANLFVASFTLGVRPEHIAFAKNAGPHTISAHVDVSEMMGSEFHLHVVAGDKDVVLRVQTTDLPEDQQGGLTYGSEIHFTFPGNLVHFFDKESELNLLAE
ncbi:MAG: TOBE domain-containing protein, partial [Oscillospiraceae bacterium]